MEQKIKVEEVRKVLESYCEIDGNIKALNNIAEKLEESEEEQRRYEERTEEYKRLKIEILREVSQLPYKQKAILIDKYINDLRWTKVAYLNHYSTRQCKNIRNTALQSLKKAFQNNETIMNYIEKEAR